MAGLKDAISLLGSADPTKFLKQFPSLKKGGGYEIEHTPHELAQTIVAIRSIPVTLRRALCLGSRTLGAERAILERIGVTEVDCVSKGPHEAVWSKNADALLEDGIKVGYTMRGPYDIVIIAGDSPMKADVVWEQMRKGSLLVVLGKGLGMGWPNLRATWNAFRHAGHRLVVDTGTGFGDMGAGVLEISHMPITEAQADDDQADDEKDSEPKPGAPNPSKAKKPKAAKKAAKKKAPKAPKAKKPKA